MHLSLALGEKVSTKIIIQGLYQVLQLYVFLYMNFYLHFPAPGHDRMRDNDFKLNEVDSNWILGRNSSL